MNGSTSAAALGAALLMVTSFVFAQSAAGKAQAEAAPPASAPKQRQLDVKPIAHIDDFDKMLERRRIIVNVPFSRTLYFIDKGTERGFSAEMVRDFERWLNKKYAMQQAAPAKK